MLCQFFSWQAKQEVCFQFTNWNMFTIPLELCWYLSLRIWKLPWAGAFSYWKSVWQDAESCLRLKNHLEKWIRKRDAWQTSCRWTEDLLHMHYLHIALDFSCMWKPTILIVEKQWHATVMGTELVLYLLWYAG